LEDALKATGHRINPQADWAVGGGKGKGKGRSTVSDNRLDIDAPKREDLSPIAVARRYSASGTLAQEALQKLEQDEVNYDLVVDLLRNDGLQRLERNCGGCVLGEQTAVDDASAKARPTGVLVFLSGAKEIERVQEELMRLEEFCREPARSWIIPLHGSLPTADQRRCFLHPPAGVRKIVLSTNVAETSITIDDIGYVVDTSRMKEMRYDAVRRMSSLEDTVASQTNARQRRGRAGRVAPGLAVHVGLTKYRHDSLIEDHQPPEVRRVPLEQLVLRIHATKLHQQFPSRKAEEVCEQLIEPPASASVEKAVEQLVRLGGIEVDEETGEETLTILGHHLSNLPLEARLGKLVLLGAAFGPAATDAALTVAAALQSRNPFVAPLEKREEANKARRHFAAQVAGGAVGPSDHLAVWAAYQEWNSLPHRGNAKFDFCQDNMLSIRTLQGMAELKSQLLQVLSEARFVRKGLTAKSVANYGRNQDGSDGVMLALTDRDPCYGTFECPPALVAALLCAALFPQVVFASAPKQQKNKGGKDTEKPKLMIRDLESGEPVKVKLHPSSVSKEETQLSSPYFVFQELVNTTQLYVRDVTPVPPLALVLFGGSLASGQAAKGLNPRIPAMAESVLTVDGWIKLSVPQLIKEPLLEVRRRLDALFVSWVADRGPDGHESMQRQGGTELLTAVVELLSIQDECAPSTVNPSEPKKGVKRAWSGGGGDSKKSKR
jgi:hypothetical protein